MSLIEQLEEEYDFHIICAKKHMTHANCVKKLLKEMRRKDEKRKISDKDIKEKEREDKKRKEKARLYYITHRDELCRKAREKYAANRDELCRKTRDNYAANREVIRRRDKKSYAEKHLIRDKSHEICKKVTADELIFRLDD